MPVTAPRPGLPHDPTAGRRRPGRLRRNRAPLPDPANQPRHLQDVLRSWTNCARQPTNISQSFHHWRAHRRRGLIIVLSDFLDDPSRSSAPVALPPQEARSHPVPSGGPHEQDFLPGLREFEDLETSRRMPVHARFWPNSTDDALGVSGGSEATLRRERYRAVLLRTDRPVETALLQYLAKRARLGRALAARKCQCPVWSFSSLVSPWPSRHGFAGDHSPHPPQRRRRVPFSTLRFLLQTDRRSARATVWWTSRSRSSYPHSVLSGSASPALLRLRSGRVGVWRSEHGRDH